MNLKVIDLFCGMGGLSWGLNKTKMIKPSYAVDNHAPALALYQSNFPDTHILNIDISQNSQIRDLIEKINFNGGVDIVVGGRPCRGFTQIRNGQNKDSDPNNKLTLKFAEIVRELNPLAFIYENVPHLEHYKLFQRFLSRLRGRNSYKIAYAVVEAANFGNPSRRSRLLVVGIRSDLGRFPIIPRGLDIPYQQFWLRRCEQEGQIRYCSKLEEPWRSYLFDPDDCRLVNVEQAISDLPILEGQTAGASRPYGNLPQSAYQHLCRQNIQETDGHIVPRIRPETRERLKAIAPGGNWRDLPTPLTYRIPYEPASGKLRRSHYSAYRRLLPESHSPTVQGHSDFAYHYKYERALTPRELARLMGFTDDYQLGHEYDTVVKAIGNAVPPVLATAIATSLLEQLN
ncbi:MAG: DNA cytosine methyltransferase [Coleofasciculus sp. D1-CHI-01]|uniref:DNA cytosine methyltransferase n=1 Tax=Coleofasciculus sp. D1-CHI-01 TaxID=3068482 RepID=UPI0032F7252E